MSPETPLLYKFREMGRRTRIGELAKDEMHSLGLLTSEPRSVEAGTELIAQGQSLESAIVVLDGWARRSVMLRDGRRQILNFSLPGDVVGVHLPVRPMAYFDMSALTDLQFGRISLADLERLQSRHPRLNALLNWTCDREAQILAEQIVRLGRRPAGQRVASLLLELRSRLLAIGRSEEEASHMPLFQEHLADSLGLSPVHINRVLRTLSAAGMLTVRRGRITIRDIDTLASYCQYDADFFEQAPFL